MESNWGEIMPELAVRHCAHILYPGSRLQQEQCTPATCWADVNVQLTEQTHGRLTGPDHLAVLKMLEKVRTFSWLGCQICCSYSPKDFSLSLSHTQHTHMHAHTTHTNPPALINHYVVQPKVKCLSQGDIGNISCILL